MMIEAITFDELLAHGRMTSATLVNGIPWAFDYKGHPITHENDDCYLIPTLEGTLRMNRGDMLITGLHGDLYVLKGRFAVMYEPAPPTAEES